MPVFLSQGIMCSDFIYYVYMHWNIPWTRLRWPRRWHANSIFWWPSLKWAHELTNAINEFKRGAFWSQSPHWGGLQTCAHLNHTMKTYWSSCIILWRVWRSNCMMKHHLADEEQTRTVIEYYLFQERSMFRSCKRHDWVCGCEVARQPLNAQLRRRTSVFTKMPNYSLKPFFYYFPVNDLIYE